MRESDEVTYKPVLLNAGRQKRKAIEDLKQGAGPLIEEIQEMAQTAAKLPAESSKEVVPVVIIYRKRDRKPRSVLSKLLRAL
jgi:hypothetical protein